MYHEYYLRINNENEYLAKQNYSTIVYKYNVQ